MPLQVQPPLAPALPLPLPIIFLRVRHDMTERSAAADRTEATLANEPIEKADKKDPMEPIERTDPTEAIDRIEPREPIHKIELSDLIDSIDLWRLVTSPMMTHQLARAPVGDLQQDQSRGAADVSRLGSTSATLVPWLRQDYGSSANTQAIWCAALSAVRR